MGQNWMVKVRVRGEDATLGLAGEGEGLRDIFFIQGV